jgi:hypothetical protein
MKIVKTLIQDNTMDTRYAIVESTSKESSRRITSIIYWNEIDKTRIVQESILRSVTEDMRRL